MLIKSLTLRIAFLVAACLFAAHTARAESIAFESALRFGGAQSGGQTSKGSQGGGAQPAQEVQTVALGDITGTVCDCGEISPAAGAAPGAASGGGLPRLPLLAFAAAPGIICLFDNICSPDPPRPPPPPPPPPGVPEPLTLVTFTTGLAAFAALRRRRRT